MICGRSFAIYAGCNAIADEHAGRVDDNVGSREIVCMRVRFDALAFVLESGPAPTAGRPVGAGGTVLTFLAGAGFPAMRGSGFWLSIFDSSIDGIHQKRYTYGVKREAHSSYRVVGYS